MLTKTGCRPDGRPGRHLAQELDAGRAVRGQLAWQRQPLPVLEEVLRGVGAAKPELSKPCGGKTPKHVGQTWWAWMQPEKTVEIQQLPAAMSFSLCPLTQQFPKL